jgi:hypothetical protein
MNYPVEMGSGAMICIPNFIKMDLAIQMLIEDTHADIQINIRYYIKYLYLKVN